MKHKLMGNIDFVGELFKETLITDPIINSVFECLMGYGENGNSLNFNDNTVEASLNLINKIGHTLSDKANEQSEKPK